MAEAEPKKRPPYAGAGDIEAFFDRIKTMQAPKKIDADWAATYNLAPNQPVAIPNLLKWLGLIDKDGAASAETWDPIRLPATRADALAPMIRMAYAEVFDRIDVEHATDEDLAGTFVVAYGMGDPRRQVRCFLTLCEMAGVTTGTEAKKKPGPAPSGPSKPKQAKQPKPPVAERAAKPAEKAKPAQNTSSVTLSLNIEIPAEWTEEQIRERLATVSRAAGQVDS